MIGTVKDSAPRKIEVLIVDDDRWTTRAVARTLNDAVDVTVVGQVHSGADAVTAYTELRPDVVLMDVHMPPGISGIDATAAVLRQDPAAKVVLLTTVSPGPGLARALEAGALGAVNKDALEEVLVQTVRAAAGGETLGRLRSLREDILLSGGALPETTARAPRLTRAERMTLELICDGFEYPEIASRLSVSVNTVKSHASRLRDKLGAHNQAQLVVQAMRFKFVTEW